MLFVEGKGSVTRVVEHQLREGPRGLMAAVAAACSPRAKLPGVRVFVTRRAGSSWHDAERSRCWNHVTGIAIDFGMAIFQSELGPALVLETVARASAEGLLIVAACAAEPALRMFRAAQLAEAPAVGVVVTTDAVLDVSSMRFRHQPEATAVGIGRGTRRVTDRAFRAGMGADKLEPRCARVVEVAFRNVREGRASVALRTVVAGVCHGAYVNVRVTGCAVFRGRSEDLDDATEAPAERVRRRASVVAGLALRVEVCAGEFEPGPHSMLESVTSAVLEGARRVTRVASGRRGGLLIRREQQAIVRIRVTTGALAFDGGEVRTRQVAFHRDCMAVGAVGARVALRERELRLRVRLGVEGGGYKGRACVAIEAREASEGPRIELRCVWACVALGAVVGPALRFVARFVATSAVGLVVGSC